LTREIGKGRQKMEKKVRKETVYLSADEDETETTNDKGYEKRREEGFKRDREEKEKERKRVAEQVKNLEYMVTRKAAREKKGQEKVGVNNTVVESQNKQSGETAAETEISSKTAKQETTQETGTTAGIAAETIARKGEAAGMTVGTGTDRIIRMTGLGTGETRGTENGVGHSPETDRTDLGIEDTTYRIGPGREEMTDRADPGTEVRIDRKDPGQGGMTGKTEDEARRDGKTGQHGHITPVQGEITPDTGQGQRVDKERQETGVTVGT
jgi:hypothetical protein